MPNATTQPRFAQPPPFTPTAARAADRLDRRLDAEREAERIRRDRLAELRSQIATCEMLRRLGRVSDPVSFDKKIADAREYLARHLPKDGAR